MSVLKAVADNGPESRLSDLAREVGLNKTTVFRLLSALESAEMIERTPSGTTYRLGPELVRLSRLALDQLGRQRLLPAPRRERHVRVGHRRGTGRPGDGAVVLFHAWPPGTLDALPAIVDGLRDAGATFVRIDELERFG